MFSKIKRTFSAKNSLESLVEKTKENVLKRSNELDFHLLGRSLSCNPFLPRAFDRDFKYCIQNDKKIIDAVEINNEKSLESLNQHLELVIVDTILSDDISLVAIARRYSPYLIIHKDIIISKYQILESVVYGADMIILDGNILDSDALGFLFEFASNLGLVSILLPNDIKYIESYFDFIMLQDLENLPYIPNGKMIIHQKY
ncbi:hypothetical protein CCY99_00030 [Helicobacter sp. 16-1353]|uniref:hypothetical protein n=1 Tax=Helicobacter sp. 16-1353 TaxID=2004996 RepID=UPI000DCD4211|nr:hypothetical protein [Helicobacter sp. 16-1353]RAX55124.1 hypothetical protein CCY99_00030 [Helicobacter sp. 16-1353]